MAPCHFQSLSEDLAVTFGEYCESFAAHQMTLLSCSMVGTCQTPPPTLSTIIFASSSFSSAAWVQSEKLDCDRCCWVPQRPGPEQAVSPSTPG